MRSCDSSLLQICTQAPSSRRSNIFQFANFKFVKQWEVGGQAKVALQVRSEDELLMLQAAAMSLSLTAKVIHDAGRTQIAAGSATVLGIGPAPKSLVDQVTGGLKLY